MWQKELSFQSLLLRRGVPWIEGYTTWKSPSEASSEHCVLYTFGMSHLALFLSRERFKGSKEHILHSDLSSCIANREVTVKRKARPSGRKWIGYFVYYIYYSYAQGHDESRALLSKNHCAAQSKSWCEFWRAHSQADKTKATADTKHTRFGNTAVLENICSGSWQQLYYFLIGNTDLGWVKAWITGGKGWAKWKTKVARKWEEGGESRSSRRYWTAQDPAR